MSADNHDAAGTYVTTIDADIDAAYEALLAIEPTSSLAGRLSALGLDARAVREATLRSTGPTSGDGQLGRGGRRWWRDPAPPHAV
jgi:hypothetical protein